MELPYDYYFNLKSDFEKSLFQIFVFKNKFLKYCVKKKFYQVKTIKNETISIDKGIGCIVEGKFEVKSDLQVGKFR